MPTAKRVTNQALVMEAPGAPTLGAAAPRTKRGILTTAAFWLLFLFVFSMPVENLLVLPGIGTLGRVVGLAAAIFCVFSVVETAKLRAPSLVHILLAAFVGWSCLTYFRTVASDETVVQRV